MIVTQHLRKCYGDFVAVDDLNLEIVPGEVVGLLGPNGAGKSTTMKMLSGFLTPTSGSASIFGKDIVDDSLQARRLLGYLPEGAPAWGELTPAQFLGFICDVRGLHGQARKQALAEVTDQLHLQHVWHQPIETLSKGYKRRVGLAQAILHQPKVLLLDEPTDGLDPNQKHEVRQLIQRIAQDRIILISTHILEEVEALCSRAVIIARGRILADDTPEGLEQRSRYHLAVTLRLDKPERYRDRLAALPAVSEVEIHRQQITLFPAGEQPLFPQVRELVEQERWPVQSMQLERGRLDEVFRTITMGE